jgi:hypothetical protein
LTLVHGLDSSKHAEGSANSISAERAAPKADAASLFEFQMKVTWRRGPYNKVGEHGLTG